MMQVPLGQNLKKYCHIESQHPRICLLVKFSKKAKMPIFGTKNALFGYLWAKFEINPFEFFKPTLNRKILGKKVPYFGIFNQKCPFWVFWDLNLKELSSYFILEFVLLQSLVQKLKSLKMRSKMDDTGIFISEFEKNIVIIKISSLEFV